MQTLPARSACCVFFLIAVEFAPAAVAQGCTAGSPPIQLTGRVTEGAKAVNGVSSIKGDSIQIWDVTNSSSFILPLQNGSASASSDSSTRVFNGQLADPLYQGQKIEIHEFDGMNMEKACLQFIVPGSVDWGRVRADVAAGVVLSQDNNFAASTSSGTTSQSTLFLALNVEKNWRWTGLRSPI